MEQPEPSDLDVSVVVCTRDRAASLRSVLQDLARQRDVDQFRWEVLVVDNNSSDGTRAVAEEARVGTALAIRYLFEPRAGKVFALNTAVEATSAPILGFTDDDMEIPEEWLAQILRPFSMPECLGVGGAVKPRWVCPRPAWASDAPPFRMAAAIVQYGPADHAGPVSVPPIGGNCAFRREAFLRYGGYRMMLGPNAALGALEDIEFGSRLVAAGEVIWYQPDALTYHPVTPERLTRKYFLDWYHQRGRAEPYLGRPPTGTIFWAGVPRYLFRELGVALVKWTISFEARRRFFHKIRVYLTLGAIREFHRIRPRSGRNR